MTSVERICDILESEGYQPILAVVEGKDPSGAPLLVPFRPDELGREMVLFIQMMPHNSLDDVSLVNFSLIYPLDLGDEPTIDLVRTIFLLNRYLPIGGNILCEQTPAVYFAYQLVATADGHVDENVLKETVNMIGHFTRLHVQVISQILAGEVNCDDFLAEMELTGVPLTPVVAYLSTEAVATE